MITIKPENSLWDTKHDYVEYDDKTWGPGGLKDKMHGWGDTRAINRNFNSRLYKLVPIKPMKILDIGCGGGAFIASCITDGNLAYGVDGNPYYKELKQHSWGPFPDNFFVADAGKDFTLSENNEIVKFDVITSWEFFEHIHPSAVDQMVTNIDKHSRVGTWLIFSASQRLDLPWHKTIKNKQQWVDIFGAKGFENTDTDFGGDLIRNEGDSVKCFLKKAR